MCVLLYSFVTLSQCNHIKQALRKEKCSLRLKENGIILRKMYKKRFDNSGAHNHALLHMDAAKLPISHLSTIQQGLHCLQIDVP